MSALQPEEINILLLGETGVGKTTFINSFANYMKYERLEEAEQKNFSVLIPAMFSMFDKYFKKHEIKIGTAVDDNERFKRGAAGTQDVKTYVFDVSDNKKRYNIRLIDTPGMGDPRGIKQDNKNCEYILSYLGRITQLHAICLLFSPLNSRVTVFLRYCINQILSRLEKSASQNIVFIFTNTRGQNYTPGETYGCLEEVIQEVRGISGVEIPMSFENVFCFDNEAFRYMAGIREGLEFMSGIREANVESWKYSYKEVWRMILYIIGDEDHAPLTPHNTQDTVSINTVRKMILQLTKPLAEIVELINDNIYKLTQHTEILMREHKSIEKLKLKLHMPIVDLEVVKLEKPVTVCTTSKCAQVYQIAGKNKWHYKQVCHNPCYLKDVPRDVVGDPALMDCESIHYETQNCLECGCRYNVHMHIYYETKTVEIQVEDENVSKNITTKEEANRQSEILIEKMGRQKEEMGEEHKLIVKTTAQFAYFLQKNAITPINDAYSDYIEYLISREELNNPEFQTQQSKDTITYLKQMLREYNEEKAVLKRAMERQHQNTSSIDFSPESIQIRIAKLYSLKHFGKKIRDLYDSQQTPINRELRQMEEKVDGLYYLPMRVKESLENDCCKSKGPRHRRLRRN